MKICSKCKIKKELYLFSRCSVSKSGFQSQCKKCKSDSLSLYYRENKDKIFKKTKKYQLEYYHKNKLSSNISRMVRKGLNGNKQNKTFEILGYTLNELKEHLEKLFKVGMSWENYGEWHVDHKIPQSLLKYNNPDCENFKKCWALENLQPLWAVENLIKSNKLII